MIIWLKPNHCHLPQSDHSKGIYYSDSDWNQNFNVLFTVHSVETGKYIKWHVANLGVDCMYKLWKDRFHGFRNSTSLLYWPFMCMFRSNLDILQAYSNLEAGQKCQVNVQVTVCLKIGLKHTHESLVNTIAKYCSGFHKSDLSMICIHCITVFEPRYWLFRVSELQKTLMWFFVH